MTPDVLKSLLVSAAKSLNWQADEVMEFTSPTFRSRPTESEAKPIRGLFGLRLGQYPVIVAPIALDSVEGVTSALKRLHAQMVVARSYMYEKEVINAHLFLCATSPTATGDWLRLVDLIERDEAVCRKLVWIPKEAAIQESFDALLARTFLAMPWAQVRAVSDAALDQTYDLAQRLLVKHGLTEELAQKWVSLTERLIDDPESLVTELVQSREASHE
ncbi:ABC-three component system middle component 1 [Xanthobacter sp. DSM 14520]|uniref:ABC-three component system middle component 1 n=1 Tax=Xanthobacter autotrophicus (strain ATCC BAA-1158 / Py2) TaxID=78245 RepID=UPI003728EECF